MKTKVIFHVDVNSAFLSWSAAEHLFMGGTLDYRTVNAAIAKDAAGKSIILAKSDGAKKCGVITGEPIWIAREKCPDLLIVPPNYGLYLRASNAMKQFFEEYTPQVEPFSIDECFLDMTGQEKFFGAPLEAAFALKERIKKELGFTVNIGVSSNKALAKMASGLKKPDRIHSLWPREISEKLWPKPIGFLFMAGRQSVKKLQKLGIHTVGDLAHTDQRLIWSLMGKQGETLWHYANGIDNSPVRQGELPPPKSVSQSITLPFVLHSIEEAEPIFCYIGEYLAAKLRKRKMAAAVIAVGVKDAAHQYRNKQRKTEAPLLHRRAILSYAMPLLAEIWPAEGARYVGISLGGLSEDFTLENTLFGADVLREERLDRVVYRIRDRYGEAAIGSARILGSGVKNYFRDFEAEDSGEEPPRFF